MSGGARVADVAVLDLSLPDAELRPIALAALGGTLSPMLLLINHGLSSLATAAARAANPNRSAGGGTKPGGGAGSMACPSNEQGVTVLHAVEGDDTEVGAATDLRSPPGGGEGGGLPREFERTRKAQMSHALSECPPAAPHPPDRSAAGVGG